MRKTIAASMCALLLATTGVASAQRVLSMATLAPAGSTFMNVFDAANREALVQTAVGAWAEHGTCACLPGFKGVDCSESDL